MPSSTSRSRRTELYPRCPANPPAVHGQVAEQAVSQSRQGRAGREDKAGKGAQTCRSPELAHTDNVILQAMKQGHNDIARIYAQNAVRKQNEKLNLLQLASRVDAVAGRVQTAVTMRQITGNMMKVNRSLDVAMKSMSPERVRTSPKGGFTFNADPALDRCRHGRLREAV
jgi:hypothetical protein